jgi:hypothetical protein
MASDHDSSRPAQPARPRLRLVTEADVAPGPDPVQRSAARSPRTIGRLIAQAAMLADSASVRERDRRQGLGRRIFGRHH